MNLCKRLACLFFGMMACTGLVSSQERRFSREALMQDLDFLQQQVFNVHCNPFTELDKPAFEAIFSGIRSSLRDSMTAADFYNLVKPVVAFVADEHADIGMPAYYRSHKVFPPFSLVQQNGHYLVDNVMGTQDIKKGDTIVAINGRDIKLVCDGLASYTTGMHEERNEKARIQFGYLHAMQYPHDSAWTLSFPGGRKVTVSGTGQSDWTDYLRKLYGNGTGPMFSYRKEGKTGYLASYTFSARNDSELEIASGQVDSIFQLIQKDQVSRLVIDVSQNGGGNSAVGDLFIDHIYNKPYKTYQVNWKRSDEYLKVLHSYGGDDRYEALKPGEILHYDAGTREPRADALKFTGKVYVAVGNATFSSAIMFATIIKDNNIAQLIGVTPKLGHPTHFGELYSVKLPNTQLAVRFGVKEWIRPGGTRLENILRPDILLPDTRAETILQAVANK